MPKKNKKKETAKFSVVPYRAEHLFQLEAQDAQVHISTWITKNMALQLENGISFTGMVDGLPIVCAGVAEQWEGRALAWAYVSKHAQRYFLHVHRAIKRFLETSAFRRIETSVAVDFEQGHRWVKMLGFNREAKRMRAYTPDGEDAALYAWVRK